MRKAIATGLLAGTALLASGGVAHADADSDFVAVVNGIEQDSTFSWLKIRSDSDWIKIGKSGVCGSLDNGDTLWGVTTYLANNSKVGFSIDEAGKFVAAAVENYCPNHAAPPTTPTLAAVPTHVVLPPGYSDGDGEMPTDPTAQDQAFLHNMSRYGSLVLPAGDALFYADEICRLYRQGHSVAEVQDTMVNNGIPRHVVIEMDGSAGRAYPNCGPDSPSRRW